MGIFSHWLLWLVALSLSGWLYLVLWRGAFWRAEPLPDPAVPSQQRLPDVIAVVPARNEAPYLARTLHSLIVQDYPGRVCVIVVDDSSEDLTHAIAEATKNSAGPPARGDRRPPSAGRLVGQAVGGLRRAPMRLRTDAGRALCPAHRCRRPARSRQCPPAGAAKAEADRLDLVSLMFRLHCQNLWERLLVSAVRLLLSRGLPVRRGQPAATRRSRREWRLHPGAARGACPHRRHRVEFTTT